MTFIELLDKHPMAAVIELGVAFVGVIHKFDVRRVGDSFAYPWKKETKPSNSGD